ncbi:MAG: flagellar hook-associated protein FlgK [Phycisphaerae bacterium]
MALLGASFQIGRSALAAYQAALSIVGQNIANVGNPDYTRQSGSLTPLVGGPAADGINPGAGVRMSQLRRHIDEAVESRLRLSISARSAAQTRYSALSQVEALYNELTQQDVSSQLSDMFGSFGALQTEPTESAARSQVIATADGLVRSLQRQRSGLVQQVGDLNTDLATATRRAGEIADEIADLNGQIVAAASGASDASSPLRDRRDSLLRELSDLMDVQVRHQENGSANVYVGSEPLVEFDRSRGLRVEVTQQNGLEIGTVRFADNNGTVIVRDGKLAGIVTARDQGVVPQLDRLDTLARGVIYEVNRVHSQGVGLVGYSSIAGLYDVNDPNAALNTTAAGLTFPVKNGTFVVNVRDPSSGQVITRQIEVDLDGLNNDDTTLNSLAADLSAVPGLSAIVTSDNRLQISASGSGQFWFSDDSSGALAALGVGAFFSGTSAADIDVVGAIRNDPRLIAASKSGGPNDGSNAGDLASLIEQSSALLSGASIQGYHADTINALAVATGAAQTESDAGDSIYNGLVAQREAVSGVSLDEEAINLTKFEKAFQGATRFLNVVDGLTSDVLSLVR